MINRYNINKKCKYNVYVENKGSLKNLTKIEDIRGVIDWSCMI